MVFYKPCPFCKHSRSLVPCEFGCRTLKCQSCNKEYYESFEEDEKEIITSHDPLCEKDVLDESENL
jgi:hypothetical protein